MTRNARFKRVVRERARRTHESYSTARATLRRRGMAPDADVVTRCAAPIVSRMRDADPAVRRGVVPGLNREQGELIAFWILFVHLGDGLNGLCRAHPHRVVDPDFWTLIQVGLRRHRGLLRVAEGTRAEVQRAQVGVRERGDYAWLEFLDVGALDALDAEFKRVIPDSLHRLAERIRTDPGRFATDEVDR